MYKLGITGHANIEKANNKTLIKYGNIYDEETYIKVNNEIKNMINEIIKEKDIKKEDLIFISGMARGVDECFALYALLNNIPLIASIPNSLQWHKNRSLTRGNIRAQAIYYDKIINYINERIKNGCKYSKIIEVKKNYNGKLYKYANFARNQNIIDESDGVISYYKYNSSGTKDGIIKAKENNKYIGNVSDFGRNKNILRTFKIRYDKDLFEYDSHILIHGCNCFNTMGKGIAKIIKDTYPQAYEADLKTKKGDRNKLGTFTYADVNPHNEKGKIKYIVNAYTQYTFYDKKDMFYIESFKKSLNNIIQYFIKKRKKHKKIKFSFPAIGLGLANGNINEIYKALIEISKKYEHEEIELNLCLHEKDIKLKKEFQKLEKEKEQYYLEKKKSTHLNNK